MKQIIVDTSSILFGLSHGIDVFKAQIADGFDESIIHLVERELKAHESNIVLGDQERSQWVGASHAACTDILYSVC